MKKKRVVLNVRWRNSGEKAGRKRGMVQEVKVIERSE